jgi:hypothetical protein
MILMVRRDLNKIGNIFRDFIGNGVLHGMITKTICTHDNIFTEYYIKKYFPKSPEWVKQEHIEAFNKIKKLYESEKESFISYNEAQLREHFFNKVFEILGFAYEVSMVTPGSKKRYPDYGFFEDNEDRKKSRKDYGTFEGFIKTIGIGEVKKWIVDLDTSSTDEDNINRNPSAQIYNYLQLTNRRWGILSNGKVWRLYCSDKPRSHYFEVNLPNILESNDIENFKLFYYFFRKNAFISTKDGIAFLDRILIGSGEYAVEIGDDLKDNVYMAIKILCEGFIKRSSNKLDRNNPDTLIKVQTNAMILLYRFLFLLYAEGKGLLDTNDTKYCNSYSFKHIVRKIANRECDDAGKMILQSELKSLFDLIDQGSEVFPEFKNSGMKFIIPAYNGGLFNPKKHLDLEIWKIEDHYLAKAIDLLTRRKNKNGEFENIDYSTLDIQHLGSIYEGLLEYKLMVAQSDLVVNKDGKWVTLEEFNSDKKIKRKKLFLEFNENDKVCSGSLYLSTGSGERKSTGSYYTHSYIVKYIIRKTIGPIVRERCAFAKKNGTSYKDAILSIKVLDPSMGSGHFLVEAVEFLAQEFVDAVQKDFEMGKVTDVSVYTDEFAKREVLAHCIYGVDLNDLAVELAKIGLWLTTISRDKPLSFLDHKLKQGNSLIGSRLTLVRYHPDDKRCNGKQLELPESISPNFVGKILNALKSISDIKDDTIDNVKRKEELFEKFKLLPEYIKAKLIADIHTSIYFGNNVPADLYGNLVWALRGDNREWDYKTRHSWVKQASDIANEKSFFHWELEFPEIFFDAGKLRENSGWDVIIGNPPYGVKLSEDDQLYYIDKFKIGTTNTAALFMRSQIGHLKNKGFGGYIVPKGFIYVSEWKKVCIMLFKSITNVVDVGKAWEDVKLEQTIYIFQKGVDVSKYTSHSNKNGVIIDLGEISKSLCKKFGMILNGVTNIEVLLAEKMLLQDVFLNDLVTNQRGFGFQKFINQKKIGVKVIGGKQIIRYGLKEEVKGWVDIKNVIDDKALIDSNGIIVQNIIAHIQKPIDHIKIIATIANENSGVILDTVNQLKNKSNFSNYYILGVLNSKLINWYVYRFIFAKAIRTMHFDSPVTQKIPYPKLNFGSSVDKDIHDEITKYAKNLIDLNIKLSCVKTIADEIHIKREIDSVEQKINVLVYDLYKLTDDEKLLVEQSFTGDKNVQEI